MHQTPLKAYIVSLTLVAASLVASWVYWYGVTFDLWFVVGVVVLAAFALFGDIFSVRLNERTSMGAWGIALMMAAVALGPAWAALAALPSALYVGRGSLLRTMYEIGHSVTIVCAAGMVFSLTSEPLLSGSSAPLAVILYATLIAGVVFEGADGFINAGLLRIKYSQPLRETWNDSIQPYLLSDTVNVLTAGLSVLALASYGPIAALVVVIGSIGSVVLLHRSREQVTEIRALRERVGSLEEALNSSNATFGTMIIRDLGRRDGYTHRHAAATAVYASDLAEELALDAAVVGRLRMTGLLHNIGLFSLPEELLLASGKLNSIAQGQLAEHPVRGEQALAAIPEFKEMASWVRWHHERVDGRGYPDKLRDPWIPLEAKMLAVAEGYAAMILDQPRRPGMTPTAARERLVSEIDKCFDRTLVRAFLRILDTESEGYRMADDQRFLFPDAVKASLDGERLRTGSEDASAKESSDF